MTVGEKIFLDHDENEAEIYFTTDGSVPKIGSESTKVILRIKPNR